MKKIWIALLSSIVVLVWGTYVYADDVLETDVVGKWVNSKMVLNEEETVVGNDLDGQETFWEFTDNGYVTMALNGKERVGTWYVSNDTIVAELIGEKEIILTLEDGMLKETINDGFYFYYVKKENVEKRNAELMNNYDETPVEDELVDVLNNGEILAYGGLTLSEDYRYYLCHQNQSGFDSSVDYYGIYDYGTKSWPIEMQEMDFFIDGAEQYLEYVGDGMFLYDHYSDRKYYLSASLGDYFSIDFDTYFQGKYFQGGYSIGTRANNNLEMLSVYGEVTDTGIRGGTVDYQCDKGFVVRQTDWDGNTEDVILYYYDTNQAISLDETYATKITSDAIFKMTDDYLYVKNIVGMDGQYYYAVFDKFGSIVVPATLMADFDYESYKDEAGTVLYESDTCKIIMVDEYYSNLNNNGSYVMEFYFENKKEQHVLFTLADSYLNDKHCNTVASVLVPAGEGTYYGVSWGSNTSFRELHSKEVYSALLKWIVTDENSDEMFDTIFFEALD